MGLGADERRDLEAVVKVGYDGSVSDRAAMVLAWDAGESVAGIARRLGTSRPTVYKWVRRFEADGLDGLVKSCLHGAAAFGVGSRSRTDRRLDADVPA